MIAKVSYHKGHAGLHRVTPMANVLLLVGFLAAVLVSPSILVKLGVFLLVISLLVISGERVGSFLSKTRFVLLFGVVLFIAQALSTREGNVLLSYGLVVTDSGLLAGAQMAFRFLVIFSSSVLFVLVTDPDRLAHSIEQIGIPYRYSFVLVLSLRFVPFFRKEYRAVRDAQQVRGINTSIRGFAGLLRSIRYTLFPLLVSGLIRADSIAISMKGRCFGLYAKRTIAYKEHWQRADWIVLFLFCLLLATSALARKYAWL